MAISNVIASLPSWRPGILGLILLLALVVPCLVTLPLSLSRYDIQRLGAQQSRSFESPSWTEPMGTDLHGRSLMWRCLLGGAISLSIGICAAGLSVIIGVGWGSLAGYAGGRMDALMMRIVDILYGLPYILLVVLVNLALKPFMGRWLAKLLPADTAAGLVDVMTLLIAIGGVSWLTMARVIRGQVLSLRSQPFVEAARACGLGPMRIMLRHLLPNLVGPIVVYTTLTVPSAILQESFLSFLGIGVQAPLPSWGNLASEGLGELFTLGTGLGPMRWWLIFWPCLLLGLTLMALNFLGDDLRQRLDPHTRR